jgi:uncharacterized protein (TIGR02145 family)
LQSFAGKKGISIKIFLLKWSPEPIQKNGALPKSQMSRKEKNYQMKNKKSISIYPIIILGIAILIIVSCKKSDDEDNNNNTPANTVTDIDGNVYHTVTIGTQVWMVENLKTTKFNDGTDIPLVNEDLEWEILTTPGYCWYSNNASVYKNTYGALYNWYAINSGKLAPVGWHIPTDAEWSTLTDYLGGIEVAGKMLKEAGTGHWASPNTEAINSVGFTALPGGTRELTGFGADFGGLGYFGHWWSSTEFTSTEAWTRMVDYIDIKVFRINSIMANGYSVRCIKD